MKKFVIFLGLLAGLVSSDKCDSLKKLNDIVGCQSEIIPGWTNDGLDAGPWRLPKWDYVWEVCGKDEAWYGWKLHSGVGSISTTLTASGSAELSFGNCWAFGTVKVYLDDIEIASAGPVEHKTVTFDFQSGAVLSIRDEGDNSVIQISKFEILTCSSGNGMCNPDLKPFQTYLNTFSAGGSDPDLIWIDGQSQGLGCIGLAPKFAMNFSEAVSFCDSIGMRFVQIYGENQNNFIKELVTNNPPDSTFAPTMGYWIGLERVEDTYQGIWNGTNTVSTNTWKWNNCDFVVKFTSWSNEGNYYENYGDDNIHAYMISSGYPRVALDWNTADDIITASPLCQVFPHGFKDEEMGKFGLGACPSEECSWEDIMFDGAAKGSVNADTAEECQFLCQSDTVGENCDFWSWAPKDSDILTPKDEKNCLQYMTGWQGWNDSGRKPLNGAISGPKFNNFWLC